MTTKLRQSLATFCGFSAAVSAFVAVSVADGSAHETAVRCGGAVAFVTFALLWDKIRK